MTELFKGPSNMQGEEKPGLFSKQAAQTRQDSGVASDVGSAISRMRVLEERFSNSRTEVKMIEDNMIRKSKKLGTDIKTITSEMNDFKREIEEIKEKVMLIVRELQSMAKREDVQILQKYIEMWEPLNFVTHNEMKEALDERAGAKKEEKEGQNTNI